MASPSSSPPSSTFDLSSRALKLSDPADLDPHIAPLRSSTAHTTIILAGNTLGAPAAETLAPLLAAQQSLHTARLADLFTGRLLHEIPPALSSLLTALTQCPRLHTVDLSDNAFGLNTVAPLAAFLRAHVPLRHLILNNNGMGPRAGAQLGDALAELAARKEAARKEGKSEDEVPDLETIACGRNRLEAGSMRAWAGALRAHPRIKALRLPQNGIRPEGIATLLSEGLQGCERLEVLDLQDNTLTVTGGRALAGVVGGWTALRELQIGDCYLTARGATLLCEALGKGQNTALRKVGLQYDEIDAAGFEALVAVAKGGALPALQRVELNGNKFSEDHEGVDALREILSERREKAGADPEDEGWGLDELDEMEDESDEEEEEGEEAEEEEDEEEEREVKAEKVLKEADQAEGENVAQEKDKDVDALADALGKKLEV